MQVLHGNRRCAVRWGGEGRKVERARQAPGDEHTDGNEPKDSMPSQEAPTSAFPAHTPS